MRDFLGNGRVLRPLLEVIARAADFLAESRGQEHYEALEQSTLLALRIIDLAFSNEEAFARYEAVCPPRIDKIPLHVALTRVPAHSVAIAKLVGYEFSHQIALYAARVIYNLNHQSRDLARFFGEPEVHLHVIASFVSCLQNDTDLTSEPDGAAAADAGETARWVVLRTMIESLTKPAPNLTHVLLAWTPHGRNFSQLGIVTPLHVVLELLESQDVLF
jgi:hypothetical protein